MFIKPITRPATPATRTPSPSRPPSPTRSGQHQRQPSSPNQGRGPQSASPQTSPRPQRTASSSGSGWQHLAISQATNQASRSQTPGQTQQATTGGGWQNVRNNQQDSQVPAPIHGDGTGQASQTDDGPLRLRGGSPTQQLVEDTETQINNIKEKIAITQRYIDGIKNDITSENGRRDRLNSLLGQKRNSIDALSSNLADKNRQLQEAQNELGRNPEDPTLQNRVNELQGEANRITNALNSVQQNKREIEQDLNRVEQRIGSLNDSLRWREGVVNDNTRVLNNLERRLADLRLQAARELSEQQAEQQANGPRRSQWWT